MEGASHYTSHATSLALKEAGAPQISDDFKTSVWAVALSKRRGPATKPGVALFTGDELEGPEDARAFRLDEILEALAAVGDVALDASFKTAPDVKWVARHARRGDHVNAFSSGYAATAVQAAASCWLAVLHGKAL